jgi:hypothetical protein
MAPRRLLISKSIKRRGFRFLLQIRYSIEEHKPELFNLLEVIAMFGVMVRIVSPRSGANVTG